MKKAWIISIVLAVCLCGCNDDGTGSKEAAFLGLNESVIDYKQHEDTDVPLNPVVPEPATMALFAMGCGGLYLMKRYGK